MKLNRRQFLAQAGTAAVSSTLAAKVFAQAQPADYRLEIAPLKLEIAPGKTVRTTAYNGRVPGPLIRWPEGKPITIDLTNHSDNPEIVHWHGLWIPSTRTARWKKAHR